MSKFIFFIFFFQDFCPLYGLQASRATTAIISGLSLLSHIYRIYCEVNTSLLYIEILLQWLQLENDFFFAILSLISVCFFFQKWSYWMDISNILELCALAAAIITVVSKGIYHNERFEFSFGIIAVLLAYLTLMSYLQR